MYTLKRSDGLVKRSEDVRWIEFNEEGSGKEIDYSKLKLNLKYLDVDLDELVQNSVEDIVTDEDVEYLKQMYLTIKSPYTK